MPLNWQQLYADRTQRMQVSDIREILKVTQQPDIISLAGGLPAPELFPVDEYRRAFEWVFESDGARALQYGPSEGYLPLREFVAERLSRQGSTFAASDVLITNGSQQALDLVARVLLNPGDQVVVEKPSYLGALQAFDQYQPRYTVVPMDENGMRVDLLEGLLQADRGPGGPNRIKLIYAVPNFQNPTGRTLARDRRQALVALGSRFGVPVLEDDPYGELRYEGEPLPSLKSLDTDGTVVYLGTFSKILAPGFRLGWVTADPGFLEMLLCGKQAADLHTSTASQMATYEVAKDGFVDRHVERIKAFYKERRDVMLEALAEHFPPEATFTRPEGGLFVWAELPEHIDTRELLLQAMQEKVAFVPGQGFHADGTGTNTLRMNFSNVPPDMLREGVRRVGRAIQRQLERTRPAESPVAI